MTAGSQSSACGFFSRSISCRPCSAPHCPPSIATFRCGPESATIAAGEGPHTHLSPTPLPTPAHPHPHTRPPYQLPFIYNPCILPHPTAPTLSHTDSSCRSVLTVIYLLLEQMNSLRLNRSPLSCPPPPPCRPLILAWTWWRYVLTAILALLMQSGSRLKLFLWEWRSYGARLDIGGRRLGKGVKHEAGGQGG